MSATEPLTRAQMEILEFERATWKYPGYRESVILERFGHNWVRHAQLVHHIITLPAALEYDPVLVRRLITLRDQRAARRARGTW